MPSKIFLLVALVVAILVAVDLTRKGHRWEAGVTVTAAGYFALRLFGVLGRRRDDERA
jgi:hypothetical protein